ncbi:hypothetical protein EON65_17105 [archaeon]|nr:MAG: hypothetical protein EON65_17105 [archaeon]
MSIDHGAKLCAVSINVPDPDAYVAFYTKNFQVPHDSETNSLQFLSGAALRVNKWSSGQMKEEFEVGEVSSYCLDYCRVTIHIYCCHS